MADKLLEVVSNRPGATKVTLIDREPSTTGWRLKAQDLGTAEYDSIFSGMRGTQGAIKAGARAKNRVSTWTLESVGDSRDDVLAMLTQLYALDEELQRYGGTATIRHQGGTFKMHLRVLDSGVTHQGFDFLWEHHNRFTITLGVVTPPYMEGDPLDFTDDFSSDSEADYRIDTGAGADILVTGGALTVTANPTTEKRLTHTARGYLYGDHQVTIKPIPGSTISSFLAGVTLKVVDVSNYLRVYVDDNGTNSRLRIDAVVAGVTTNRASVNLGARVSNGTPFWVRGRIEGVTVYAEFFTAAPSPMASPTSSTSYTLSGADLTTFATTVFGAPGIVWAPQQSAATIDDFDVQAYVYRNVSLPELLSMYGPIYGDADSLVDVEITPSGGAAAPIWTMFGWWRRPGVSNLVWNGDFENTLLAANGWSVASIANLNSGAATSITRITTAGKYGAASGQIVAPASADRGASFRIFRRFKKGVTYTAEVWIHSAAGVTNTYIRLGNAAANDKATSGNTALSTAWQRITVTWTPTADYDDAHVAINIAAATGTTFEIDGVMVYEGVAAPTSANQAEGRGGFPPYGVLEAENAGAQSGTITSSASYRSGFGLSGAGIASKIVVDPSLLAPDDFTQDEIAVEVWLRYQTTAADGGVTVRSLLYAQPLSNSSLQNIYSDEFGSDGKVLATPSSGTVRRFTRLGTLRLPTCGGRFLLAIETLNATVTEYDYFVLVPTTARALSPSGRANDSKYPKFDPITTEITRRIRSDLSGTLTEPSTGAPQSAAPGLGGSLIELPPANVDAVVKLSSLVPDDPTSNTNDEQLAHSATIHFDKTPRWRLGRSS